MLILQRKIGQAIFIGNDIKITIQDISSDKVKIAIDAPKDIKIIRDELKNAEINNQEALSSSDKGLSILKKLLDR